MDIPICNSGGVTRGATVIFDHFARFRLEMHLGYERDGKIQPSKTGAFSSHLHNTLIRWKLHCYVREWN
jgi:hypothetical protein